jgi:Flp pilus assembly pilin Flp
VQFVRDRSGLGMLEYSLILGLVAMVSIAVLLMLGGGSDSSLRRSANNFPQTPAAFATP